jgi:hypothetical protein
MSGAATASCLAQLGELGAQPAPRQPGQDLGSRPPASSARSIARPETPSTSAATEPSRIEASSRVLWMRWHSAVWAWKGPLAVAGQVPQLAEGRRRDEAAPQQPTLQQLAQPGGIAHVGLAAGQELDVPGVD